MRPCYELSTLARAGYGTCAIVLMLATLLILVTVCMLHMKRRYLMGAAFLNVIVLFLLQGIGDVSYNMERGEKFSFFAATIGNLPYAVIAICMLLFAVAEALFIIHIWERKKDMLTRGAIKESLDALPDGVCLFDKDGQPLLINRQMHRIAGQLFDSGILNANRFWSGLKQKVVCENAEVVCTQPTVMVCTGDGKVWDFQRNILEIDSVELQEMIAYDVTEQYKLRQELEQKNESLSKINERLKNYSRQMERITREKEILTAKIQVHDDVGRSLLAFRSYLAQPKGVRDRNSLMILWRHTIAVLRNEALPKQQCNDWELLQEAAQAVDVTIEKKGELPNTEKERAVIIAALHECLTNTVKHAKGNQLSIFIWSDKESLQAELRNNGNLPKGEIRETGGLKNLRRSVEEAGGIMTIESSPCFVLRIQFAKGEQ